MNIERYKIEIQRTWNTDGMTEREQILNATLGLVGESMEAHNNSEDSEELGDVFFYAYTLQRLLGGPRPIDERPSGFYLWAFSGMIAEAVKKHLFHGADPSIARELLEDMIMTLHALAYDMGCTPSEVMSENIAKLRARYPDGFVPGGGVRYD